MTYTQHMNNYKGFLQQQGSEQYSINLPKALGLLIQLALSKRLSTRIMTDLMVTSFKFQ